MNAVTDAYLEAAASSDQTVVTTVEVWTGPSASAPPEKIVTLGNVVGGSWSEDETRSPRRQASLTIESQGLGYDDLVPVAPGDLLHPITGNEVRLFRGFRYADGTEELAPQGVYRMSKPAVADTGDKVEIAVTLDDRSVEVTRRSYTAPYPIAQGTAIDVAVQELIDSRMPGLAYNLEPTDYTVGAAVVYGSQLGTGQVDPMADAISLALAGGMEVFFDAVGTLTLRTPPDPLTSPLALTFAEGPTCTATEFDRQLDETSTYNGVIVIGNGPSAPPVQVAVWVTDPNSPVYPATWGYKPYYLVSPLITTTAQAQAAGASMLQQLMTAYDDTGFTAVPNGALTAGDVVALARARIGLAGNYCASRLDFSAEPGGLMTVTNRARRAAA